MTTEQKTQYNADVLNYFWSFLGFLVAILAAIEIVS